MATSHPSDISLPLTTVVSMPDSTMPVSIIPTLETIDEVPSKDELTQPFLGRKISVRKSFMADVSRRLARRRLLHNRL
jgi:hypothetical protein